MKLKIIGTVLLAMTAVGLVWGARARVCSDVYCAELASVPGGSPSLQTVRSLSDRGPHEAAQVVRERLEELYGK